MSKLKGKIVLEYLNKWGNLPSNTLARKIYNENSQVFTSVDAVRGIIRYYRGACGVKNLSKLLVKDFVDYNPYKLPESDESDFFPYILPDLKSVLLLSDIHIPYHSIEALTIALKYGLDNCDSVILNGDIIDCHSLSKFNPDPRKRSIAEELEQFRDFIAFLVKHFKFVFYKPGNHEERWEKYMIVKCAELLNLQEFELSNLLRLKDNGVETISCPKQVLKLKSLNIIHGHEYPGGVVQPVNPARGLFLKAKSSTICGHFHQPSEHTEMDINGKVTTCWSTGHLAEPHPHYMPLNKWSHGFAHITTNEDSYNVKNIRIVEGRIV